MLAFKICWLLNEPLANAGHSVSFFDRDVAPAYIEIRKLVPFHGVNADLTLVQIIVNYSQTRTCLLAMDVGTENVVSVRGRGHD